MDFTVDPQTKAIIIDYINVAKVRVNYYLIDLEILFSKTPFINSVGCCMIMTWLIGYPRFQLRAAILV